MTLPALAVGFLPVLLLLGGLVVMDSFKLVSRREVVYSIAAGAVAALLAFAVHAFLAQRLGVDPAVLRLYVAPLVEETLKAGFVAFLIRGEKVGFMVDAAIHGFAAGAGFALVENVYFTGVLGGAGILVWVVRGLGTAVLHGSTTAVIAIVSKQLTDRHQSRSWIWFLPGFAIAFAAHSAYNHLILPPLLATSVLLSTMPLLLFVVFEISERAARDWLGSSLDSDAELLELILSGEIVGSPAGRYIESLRSRFPERVVGDMMSLLQIHVELSMRSKGILIARQAGVELGIDDEVRANLREMKFLEGSIGETGLMALMPLRRTSSRDLWQLTRLKKGG
jgi:RsiW-degrading membrane proteinase PrsW (M82 family)